MLYGRCSLNEKLHSAYKDRVEIYNSGAFPAGYEPEDFITGGERPVRRNPLITSILYYSKDVESFGTGLKRIADACNAENCRYEFKIMKSGFVVVFYRSTDAANDLGDTLQVTHQVTPQVISQANIQDKISAFCLQAHSKAEIMAYLGYKDKQNFTKKYLKPMIKAGQLKMTMPDKPNSSKQKYVAAKPHADK